MDELTWVWSVINTGLDKFKYEYSTDSYFYLHVQKFAGFLEMLVEAADAAGMSRDRVAASLPIDNIMQVLYDRSQRAKTVDALIASGRLHQADYLFNQDGD